MTMRRYCPDCPWSGQKSDVITNRQEGAEVCPRCGAIIRRID